MKQKILIIGLLAMASLKSFAQDIEYYYDKAGNRTARKVIPPEPPAQAQVETTYDTTQVYNTGGEKGSKTETKTKTEPEVYEDLLAEKQLRIYPNPTRGKLAIEIVNYNLNDNGSIRVFDMSGRLLQNITTLSEHLKIDITSEPPGSYIMIIVIGNEKSEWKIIKQ